MAIAVKQDDKDQVDDLSNTISTSIYFEKEFKDDHNYSIKDLRKMKNKTMNKSEAQKLIRKIQKTLRDTITRKDDEDANKIQDMTMASGEFKVLCKGDDFDFGIGGSDTLLDDTGAVLSAVALPGTGGDDETYAYFNDTSDEYKYTVTPMPGVANIYTEPKLLVPSDIFSKVVDINVDIDAESLAAINDHPTYEQFVPFTEVSVSNRRRQDQDQRPVDPLARCLCGFEECTLSD